MDKQKFLIELAELLEVEPEELKPTTILESFYTWDSLAFVSTIALMETSFNVSINEHLLLNCKTVSDLLVLITEPSIDASICHAS
jgi:acyl carrier protein